MGILFSPTRIRNTKTPSVSNVVSTVEFGCPIDLVKLVKKARNAEYNPRRLGAVVLRLSNPTATALVFPKGKLMVLGTKTTEQSRLAAKKFCRMVKKCGFDVKFLNWRVVNLIAHVNIGFPINIREFYGSPHSSFMSRYIPDVFPGLVYKMLDPKLTITIFRSGKLSLAGARSVTDINTAFKNIRTVLEEYELPDNTTAKSSSTSSSSSKSNGHSNSLKSAKS